MKKKKMISNEKTKRKIGLFNLIIIATILITILFLSTIVSAQMCNIEDAKLILKKALIDYLPAPKLSKLNATEIRDLLNFYLDSANLTTTKCDMKATLSKINYEDIINEFSNLTADVRIPYCDDGTHYGECSATKPKYCFAGQLVNRCRKCGCPAGQTCQIDERAEFTINEGKWGKCVSAIPIIGNITILKDIDGDGINDTLVDPGISMIQGGNASCIDDNILIFVPWDGGYSLKYYNLNTGKIVNTNIECSRESIAISNNIIAMVSDNLVRYYNINTGRVSDTGMTTPGAEISDNIIVSSSDFVPNRINITYYDIYTDNIVTTNISLNLAVTTISNNIIAFRTYENTPPYLAYLMYYDVNTKKTVKTNVIASRGLMVSDNNIIVFSTYESDLNEDINKDGDLSDYTLQYYNINTNTVTIIDVSDDYDYVSRNSFDISGNIIAFVHGNQSLKYEQDRKLKYYDINTKKIIDTGVNARSVGISGNIIVIQSGYYTLKYVILSGLEKKETKDISCNFGCSARKPRYCDNGNVVDNCNVCGCPSNQFCQTNGSCIVAKPCSNGTIHGNCSLTKPLYCQNGTLIENCSICGCNSRQACQTNGSCIIQQCSDKTSYNNCSITKPLYCENETLIDKCSICGCSENQTCLANETCATPQIITNFSDGSIEKNITFNGTGNQTIYIEIPKDANVTNATIDITPNVTNASLDVGADGTPEWTANETNGKISNETNVTTPITETTPDLSPEINEYIDGKNNITEPTPTPETTTTPEATPTEPPPETPPTELPTEPPPETAPTTELTPAVIGTAIYTASGNILVPLTFYSASPGTIKVSNLAITYVTIAPPENLKLSFFERIWEFIKKLFTSKK